MRKVREHLKRAADKHRQTHEEALRAAAVALARKDATGTLGVPPPGLQGPEEGYWAVGEE
jgi:hypothetical protein